MTSDPFCSNCGYSLKGLIESSKCPECGRPLVEVLVRSPIEQKFIGRRYKSRLTLFGLPFIHIALGPSDDGMRGRARGVIAIGDMAQGVIAIGGSAIGVVALGGAAFGLICFGGLAVGLFAFGGGAIGGVAVGGGAAGFIAEGGGAIGYYARGGDGFGVHLVTFKRRDPEAVRFFAEKEWLFGKPPPSQPWQFPAWCAACSLAIGVICCLLAAFKDWNSERRKKTACR